MRKILVIGSGGSGKTTLAREIGARMELPVIHLDTLYWRAGWVETPAPEWAFDTGAPSGDIAAGHHRTGQESPHG